jgi:hypothetical protein
MKSQASTKKISYESQAYFIKLCMVTCSMELRWKDIWLYILEVKGCPLLHWLMIIHKYVGNVHHIILLTLFNKHLCWGKNVVKNSFEILKKSFEKICTSSIYLMWWFVVASHTTWYLMVMILSLKPQWFS